MVNTVKTLRYRVYRGTYTLACIVVQAVLGPRSPEAVQGLARRCFFGSYNLLTIDSAKAGARTDSQLF